MKNTMNILKNSLLLFFCMVGCFFLFGCGLETVVVIEPPITNYGSSIYSTKDPLNWYCDFVTREIDNGELTGATFIGTEVYYKIYNNYSTLQSHRSAVSAVNTSSNNTAAATKVIESYTYQRLNVNPDQGNAVFVPTVIYDDPLPEKIDRRVYFRLKNYGKKSDERLPSIQFRAAISYPYGDGEADYLGYTAMGNTTYRYTKGTDTWTDSTGMIPVDYNDINFVVPYRTVSGGNRSFDFFDDYETKNTINVEPVEGDIDYQYTSSGFSSDYPDTYFVQLYAVSVALDTNSCSNTYSLVLDLGTIPIAKQ